ncbi:MAG TPA: MazG nucleotide pyrophosphohydrolase domain-containing protein [Verrucomicrobiae bacterium]|nr:MazG nucleotide pyrophosphohydrolase domain-containing protein [Verrucomicrobiae bacterium]
MTTEQLMARAIDIRKRYDELNASKYGDAWNGHQLALGFVGDVGDLAKIIMAKDGLRDIDGDVDEKLAHELADCLWSVLVLAHRYGVDIEKEFLNTMDHLEQRIAAEVNA